MRRGVVARLAALVAALLLVGCALPPQTRALTDAPPAGVPVRTELASVPFFPQTAYHCGPAALATALGAAGFTAQPDELAPQVYLPSRQGSLQVEMLAGARRQGALAVRLPPTLRAVLEELAGGHPVVVLQNLGLSFAPGWHYAVVVGHDLDAGTLLLRSGTVERQVLSLATFEHTWARGGHWAFVALPPGQLPVSATENEVAAATVALERSVAPAAARRAYDAALARWPGNLTLAIGAGNSRHAAGDLAGAAEVFEAASALHDSAPAWINLAAVRLEQGQSKAAEGAARRAVARAAGDPAWQAIADETLAKVLAAQPQPTPVRRRTR